MYDKLGWVKDWEHTIFAVNLFCAFIKSVANLEIDQAYDARFTSWNWQEWAFPTITAKFVEVFCIKYQIVKIMLSWIKKIGYGLVDIMLPSHAFVKNDSNLEIAIGSREGRVFVKRVSNLEIIPSRWKPVFKLSSTNLPKLLQYVILQPNSAFI